MNMYNDYSEQANANIACLFEDNEYSERKNGFLKAIKAFNEAGIRFGMACSFNLFLRGRVDEFHDFDLIVDWADVPKVKEIMEKLGGKMVRSGGNGFCESEAFMSYELGRCDFDIISGFKVITFGTQYLYRYSEDEIEYIELYDDDEEIRVPMITMEALYILYAMMEGWQPKRKYKRILIQSALEDEIRFPSIFEDALSNQNLPGWLKYEMRKLLAKNF